MKVSKKVFLSLSVFLMIMISADGQCFEGKSTKHVLDTGLTVLISEIPTSPMVSIYTLIKTGSATEGEFLGSGISHFIEHMFFKGTHSEGVGAIASKIQGMGGSINASTGLDYTVYTITVPYDRFTEGLEIAADMMINPSFEKEEVEKEREVIHGEMRLYNDRPGRKLNELAFQTVFQRHPYKIPVIGFPELLDSITRDDLVKYYQTHYTANNTIVSIGGNINTDEILPQIKELFKGYKRNFNLPRHLPQEPVQLTQRFVEKEFDAHVTRVSLNYPSVSIRHKDVFALDILAVILGRGEGSRLYKEIYRQKDYVTSVSAYNYTPYDPGAFEVNLQVTEDKTDQAIKDVLDVIEVIKKKGVTSKELKKVIAREEASYVYGNITAQQVTRSQVVDEALMGDFQFSKKYVDYLRAVTPGDIKRVAQEYLRDDRLSIVILKPFSKEVKVKEELSKSTIGEIEKITLDNGITLLLKEDHTFPYVAFNFLIEGGRHLEIEDKAGIFSLMTSLWTKGTKSRTAENIADLRETLGIHLGASAGRINFQLAGKYLSKDQEVVFDLIEDVIKKPTFPESELQQIKKSHIAAIKRRKENIGYQTQITNFKLLYPKHPFGQESTVESIEQISRQELQNLYQEYFSAKNMVISIFGDMDSKEILETLKKRFETLKSQEVEVGVVAPLSISAAVEKEIFLDKEQAMVMFGFQGDTLVGEDRYGVEVMTLILGSSFNGRLFKKIRDEYGQAYSVGGNFAPLKSTGLIYFSALTTEDAIENVKKIIREEIVDLQTNLVSDEELKSTKNYIKGNLKRSYETISSSSSQIAYDTLHGLGVDHFKNYEELIDLVTKEDVLRLAQKYLDLNHSVAVIARPKSKESNLQEK